MLNLLYRKQVRRVEGMAVMLQLLFSSTSCGDTPWSDGSACANGDVYNVENFVLCSFAHHVCSPLLQGCLRDDEKRKVVRRVISLWM